MAYLPKVRGVNQKIPGDPFFQEGFVTPREPQSVKQPSGSSLPSLSIIVATRQTLILSSDIAQLPEQPCMSPSVSLGLKFFVSK